MVAFSRGVRGSAVGAVLGVIELESDGGTDSNCHCGSDFGSPLSLLLHIDDLIQHVQDEVH